MLDTFLPQALYCVYRLHIARSRTAYTVHRGAINCSLFIYLQRNQVVFKQGRHSWNAVPSREKSETVKESGGPWSMVRSNVLPQVHSSTLQRFRTFLRLCPSVIVAYK